MHRTSLNMHLETVDSLSLTKVCTAYSVGFNLELPAFAKISELIDLSVTFKYHTFLTVTIKTVPMAVQV